MNDSIKDKPLYYILADNKKILSENLVEQTEKKNEFVEIELFQQNKIKTFTFYKHISTFPINE